MRLTPSKIQRYTLYLYLFSLNFEVFNLFGLGSTARLTGLLYFASILPNYQVFFKTSFIKPFIQPIIILWVFLTTISLLYINIYSYSFFDTTVLLNILLFWVLVNHERKDPGVLLKGMLSFSLGAVFLTLLYSAGIGIEYSGGRVSIFEDNENAIAVRLSMAAIILIYLVVSDQLTLKIWRFLFLLPIPIMVNFMFETGSRKAFFGFAGAFILGTLLHKTKHNFYKVFLLGLALIAMTYFFEILLQSEVLFNRLLKTAEEGNLGGREDIWSRIIPLIQDNIVWGVGKTGYQKFTIQTFGGIKSPHNVLLEVMAYTGIVGLLFYLYFISKSTWQAFLGYKKKKFLLPFLLLIPTWGMILGGQALGGKMVWATFAFAVSTVFLENRANENSLRN